MKLTEKKKRQGGYVTLKVLGRFALTKVLLGKNHYYSILKQIVLQCTVDGYYDYYIQ